ncbi:MAG: class I SAM-dependent methyltransferase [Janthinobacterium lividum]
MFSPKNLVLSIPSIQKLHASREALRAERDVLSAKLQRRIHTYPQADSIFHHFNKSFDAIEVMERHALFEPVPHPDYVTNFLGVRIDPKFFPTILDGRAGTVEPIPIPANWHADMAEWGAVLRAVDLAEHKFTVLELGCGWGCWMNNAGVAARRLGLEVMLGGVEGDAKHIGFAVEACAANDFASSQVTIHHGIAASRGGVALFPHQGGEDFSWGLKPVFATGDEQEGASVQSNFDKLPIISLEYLLASRERVDLLHMDIQGGEADLIDNGISNITGKVAYLVIGTHSREIEGRLFGTLLQAGWRLEIERPCIVLLSNDTPHTLVDGIQGWRNPNLTS